MLSPAADSGSYYMNANSSRLVDTGWLRWCWRAYLGSMENSFSSNLTQSTTGTMAEDLQGHDSNLDFWRNSRFYTQLNVRRLVEPYVDVPSDYSIPTLVVVNRADPLFDDGRRMAQALPKCELVEHEGSHVFGSALYPTANEARHNRWCAMIFDRSEE